MDLEKRAAFKSRRHTCMNIPFAKQACFFALPVHRSLMPHWLTHLGALGLFSVAVIDSSLIPSAFARQH